MWVLAAILGIAKIPLDNMGPYTDYPGPPTAYNTTMVILHDTSYSAYRESYFFL